MAAVDRRQKEVCGVCNQEKTPVMLIRKTGKRKMVKQCNCGMFDKSGAKIIIE